MRIDVDGDRNIAEGVADERKTHLVLTHGGVALAIEDRIDERKLPGGRSLAGEDAVAPAIEMKILGLVTNLSEPGQA